MITLYVAEELRAGELDLPDDAAQHVRVRRATVGDAVRVVNGRGVSARGTLSEIGKRRVQLELVEVRTHAPPTGLVALVPVSDRDRMLWAAEKCVELQVTRWQPVIYARSKSVSPRGEGDKFAGKVRARMAAALEQSGGVWLPEVNAEVESADAWSIEGTNRVVLDRDGAPALHTITAGTAAFAVGPEGGFEKHEIEDALRHGWSTVSLGPTTLRFETTIVAAAAVIRATQL